jgi:hypothetical protein
MLAPACSARPGSKGLSQGSPLVILQLFRVIAISTRIMMATAVTPPTRLYTSSRLRKHHSSRGCSLSFLSYFRPVGSQEMKPDLCHSAKWVCTCVSPVGLCVSESFVHTCSLSVRACARVCACGICVRVIIACACVRACACACRVRVDERVRVVCVWMRFQKLNHIEICVRV